MRGRLMLTAIAVAVSARVAIAGVTWDAPPECGSAADLAARVTAQLGRSVGADEVSARTTVVADRGAFALGTKLCGWLLLLPTSIPEEALHISLADGRTVRLLAMHAIHPEEMAMKLIKGTDALLDALDRAGVTEVLAPERAPATRRKLFGLF